MLPAIGIVALAGSWWWFHRNAQESKSESKQPSKINDHDPNSFQHNSDPSPFEAQVPSFGVYATQRILGDTDGTQLASYPIVAEALRTIGDAYLRAQASSIVDCITTFGLDNLCLLRMAAVAPCGVVAGDGDGATGQQPNPTTSGGMCPLQALTPDPATTHHALEPATHRRRHMLSLLLLEYEGLLQEYLSCNWDRLQEMAEANRGAVRWEGPACILSRRPFEGAVRTDDRMGKDDRMGSDDAVQHNGNKHVTSSVGERKEELGDGGHATPSHATSITHPAAASQNTATPAQNTATPAQNTATPTQTNHAHQTSHRRLSLDESTTRSSTAGTAHSTLSTAGTAHSTLPNGNTPLLSRSSGSFGSNPQFSTRLSVHTKRSRGERNGHRVSSMPSMADEGEEGDSRGSVAASDSVDGGSPTASSTPSETSIQTSSKPPINARALWQRARRAANKAVALRLLRAQHFKTMGEIFEDLQHANDSGITSSPPTTRQPVLLLLGGGMAAGKSSVRQLIGADVFWSKVRHPVIVEADAIKSQDAVFHELRRRFPGDPSIAQMVHEYSTETAEKVLVEAVNQQRDIVFDGTMMWRPFVEQTIAMVRDHEHFYKRGPGYHRDTQGRVVERYWERCSPDAVPQCSRSSGPRWPYRIEIVGCTCDPGLAVARGLWRFFRELRGVPIEAQLRSHQLFSENWAYYTTLVDAATLYHTGHHLTTLNKKASELAPMVIAHKSAATRGHMLVNPQAYPTFLQYKHLNTIAINRKELFGDVYALVEGDSTQDSTGVPLSDASRLCLLRGMLCEAERYASNKSTFDDLVSSSTSGTHSSGTHSTHKNVVPRSASSGGAHPDVMLPRRAYASARHASWWQREGGPKQPVRWVDDILTRS